MEKTLTAHATQCSVEGKPIVLTAPLTETIDHAGYFIQMALASLPKRMEAIINQKYPRWRELERNADGSARWRLRSCAIFPPKT